MKNQHEDIRYTCTKLQNLYKKGNERYKTNHLNDVFPFKNENNEIKTLDDYIPKFEAKEI